MSCSTGSRGRAVQNQSHVLHQHKACPRQLVNAEPLCRDTRDSHVHPLMSCLLRAQLQPHNTHTAPSPLPKPAPGCPSLCRAQFPKLCTDQGSSWRLSGSRGSPASCLSPRGSIFHFPTALKPPHTPQFPTARLTLPGPTKPTLTSPRRGAYPSNHTDPSASSSGEQI